METKHPDGAGTLRKIGRSRRCYTCRKVCKSGECITLQDGLREKNPPQQIREKQAFCEST
eukprot:4857146-Prorocentrum_lima.AAC.1